MLEHYFGLRLLVHVGDILESNPAVQTGRAGLALDAVSRIAAGTDRAIALMFRFIIAVYKTFQKAQPQRHIL